MQRNSAKPNAVIGDLHDKSARDGQCNRHRLMGTWQEDIVPPRFKRADANGCSQVIQLKIICNDQTSDAIHKALCAKSTYLCSTLISIKSPSYGPSALELQWQLNPTKAITVYGQRPGRRSTYKCKTPIRVKGKNIMKLMQLLQSGMKKP